MIKRFFVSMLFSIVCVFAMAQNQTVTHIVQRGETIESIAEYYKVSVADINKANPNADGMVYVGMKLAIPTNIKIQYKNYSDNKKADTIITSKEQTNQAPVNYMAQDREADTGKSNKMISNNSFYYGEGSSFSFLYQSDDKLYGLQMELGTKLFCLTTTLISNLKFRGKETSSTTALLGAGVRRKLVFGDNFLIQGKLYPYIGIVGSNTPKNIETDQEAKDKTEFTYGASADISLGLKLWNTSKGNSTFLHVGYDIIASEFKTKGLFKSGCIMVGLTTVLK